MINVIPDIYPTLNGITGPFDLFQPSKIEQTSLSSIGFSPTIQFSGAADHIYTLNKSFNSVDSFDGTGFTVAGTACVLTKTPSSANQYDGYIYDYGIKLGHHIKEIDISGCSTVQDVLNTIQVEMSNVTGYGIDSNGSYYLLSTERIFDMGLAGDTATVDAVAPTGLFSGISYFSGGVNESGIKDPDPDLSTYKPAQNAEFSLSGISDNTGITVHTSSGMLHMIRFVAGDSAPAPSVPPNGVLTVGIDYSGTFDIDSTTLSADMSNRTLTLTAEPAGTAGNNYYVEDGINAKTYTYLSVSPLKGTDSSRDATAVVDVSSYNDVEDLIADLTGKSIGIAPPQLASNIQFDYPMEKNGAKYQFYEFVDSASANQLDTMYKINNSKAFDLNVMRTNVANGKSIGEAFSELFTNQNIGKAAKDNLGQITGIEFSFKGSNGNDAKLFLAQGQLRSYTLDYGQWFADNPNVSIPEFLNNKGFRAYCASCNDQVFNFHFITEDLPDTPRPEADPDGEDIKHIYIDVSQVTDASSLVKAIYEQGMPDLTSSDPDLNHFMRLIADDDNLIIYDERRLTDDYLRYAVDANGDLLYPEYQWDTTYDVGGAKIADGVWDNVEIGERKIYAQDLIIHHTDKASMNIHLKIPQTTMDHLFGYDPGSQDWSEFNVMTSKSRENLLGNWAGKTRSGKTITKDEEGLLDHALNYLIGANCLVGAQNMRLKMTEANIVTQREGTIASESTIRDADMAKEMTSYTKNNVLAQAAQSMLAQANQNGAGVLKLLQ